MPRINVSSVLVDDQAKALAFYTDTLGFVAKTYVDLGEYRWLTVVSAGEPDGVELFLDPMPTRLRQPSHERLSRTASPSPSTTSA